MDSLKASMAAFSRARKQQKGGEPSPGRHNRDRGRTLDISGRSVVLDKPLGEGGFAFVWLARDTATSEEFALKKMLCQDERAVNMALREIRILERLPLQRNLVKYHGHCGGMTESGCQEFNLLFELCPGGHVLDLLERHDGKLTEDQVLHVFTEISKGVEVLHRISPPVQHRDLKVENVLIGADGAFKLCDFGSWSDRRSDPASLDKKARQELEEEIERYTTMMYRPPEMASFYNDFVLSEKVDIWMLGCILFTLMFYRHPFQDEAALAIVNAKYTFPPEEEVRFSKKMQELTHWLLAQNPEERPSSQALVEILDNFKDGGPLQLPASVVEKMELLKQTFPSRSSSTRHMTHGSRDSAGSPCPDKKRDRVKKGHKDHKERKNKEDELFGNDLGNLPPMEAPAPARNWASFGDDALTANDTRAAFPSAGSNEDRAGSSSPFSTGSRGAWPEARPRHVRTNSGATAALASGADAIWGTSVPSSGNIPAADATSLASGADAIWGTSVASNSTTQGSTPGANWPSWPKATDAAPRADAIWGTSAASTSNVQGGASAPNLHPWAAADPLGDELAGGSAFPSANGDEAKSAGSGSLFPSGPSSWPEVKASHAQKNSGAPLDVWGQVLSPSQGTDAAQQSSGANAIWGASVAPNSSNQASDARTSGGADAIWGTSVASASTVPGSAPGPNWHPWPEAAADAGNRGHPTGKWG